jgi:predicted SAM-dependent methyltransferase
MFTIKNFIQNQVRKLGYELRCVKPVHDEKRYVDLYGKESVANRNFYNISAGGHLGFGGGFSHPCWTNIDVDRPWNGSRTYNPQTDIAHDLLSLDPLPLASNSAELVHSRFSIEHITDDAAEVMFNEVFRILKHNGIFKATVPNVDLDYRAYLSNDLSYFSWIDMFSYPKNYTNYGLIGPLREASLEQIFLIHFAANASTYHTEGPAERIDDEIFKNIFKELPYEDALNFCSHKCSVEVAKKYRQNHINWWNQSKLEKKLRKAGFKTVYAIGPNQSSSPVFRNNSYFDNNWNMVALYMEAIK